MIQLNISNKLVYTLIGIFLLFSVSLAAYAYNSQYNDPSIMGHSAEELEVALPNGSTTTLNEYIQNIGSGDGKTYVPLSTKEQIELWDEGGYVDEDYTFDLSGSLPEGVEFVKLRIAMQGGAKWGNNGHGKITVHQLYGDNSSDTDSFLSKDTIYNAGGFEHDTSNQFIGNAQAKLVGDRKLKLHVKLVGPDYRKTWGVVEGYWK